MGLLSGLGARTGQRFADATNDFRTGENEEQLASGSIGAGEFVGRKAAGVAGALPQLAGAGLMTAVDTVASGVDAVTGGAVGEGLEKVMKAIASTEPVKAAMALYENASPEDKQRVSAAADLVDGLTMGLLPAALKSFANNMPTSIRGFYSGDPQLKVEGVVEASGESIASVAKGVFSPSAQAMKRHGISQGLQTEINKITLALRSGKDAIGKYVAGEALTPDEQTALDFLRRIHPTQAKEPSGVTRASQDKGALSYLEGSLLGHLSMLRQQGVEDSVLHMLGDYAYAPWVGKMAETDSWSKALIGDLADPDNVLSQSFDNANTIVNDVDALMKHFYVGDRNIVAKAVNPMKDTTLPENTQLLIREPKSAVNLTGEVYKKGPGNVLQYLQGVKNPDVQTIQWATEAINIAEKPADIARYVALKKRQATGETLTASQAGKLESLVAKMNSGKKLTPKQNVEYDELLNAQQTGKFIGQDDINLKNLEDKFDRRKEFEKKNPKLAQSRWIPDRFKPKGSQKSQAKVMEDGTIRIINSHFSGAKELGGVATFTYINKDKSQAITFVADRHDLFTVDPAGGEGLVALSRPIVTNLKESKAPTAYYAEQNNMESAFTWGSQRSAAYKQVEERMAKGMKEAQERTGVPYNPKYLEEQGAESIPSQDSLRYLSQLSEQGIPPQMQDYMQAGGNVGMAGMYGAGQGAGMLTGGSTEPVTPQ